MKKAGIIFNLCLIGIAMWNCSARAEAVELPLNRWEVGPEIYYYQYKEPDLAVKDKGAMYGVAGSYTHHNPNRMMLKADGHWAFGQVDYSSTESGSINDVDDYTFEGRVSAGYDIRINDDTFYTPFFGLGYRYLNDDSSGRASSAGDYGYERESNYFYIPVGIEFTGKLAHDWRLGVNVEYDIFWSGEQKSHLEDVSPRFNTITNDQTDGYGVRASINLQKKFSGYDISIEPFIRWWSVNDSSTSNITFAGAIVGYAYEPKNETLEIGSKVSFVF